MPLHRTRQKILKAIAEGINSESALADYLGTIADVMAYHLEALEDDDYIKCRRGAPTETTSDRLWIYEIWLTSKGEELVAELPEDLEALSAPVPLASVPMNVPAPEPELPDTKLIKKAVAEIQKRIQQLYNKYPAQKTSEQYQLAARILHYIESNSVLQDYAIAAAGQNLLNSLNNTPVGQVVIHAIEGWANEQ
ncbi:MAG: helix-turn-helix transcriptional regulator [Spirulina sp. SIO3F2]|nr:helix-turn-helix transcriptional regulator [Spirulina sp. SIO3F2]